MVEDPTTEDWRHFVILDVVEDLDEGWFVEMTDTDDLELAVDLLGPYATYEEARAAADDLLEHLGIDPKSFTRH